ncbi:glycosyltransferase family 4 protein [Clostridium felsineum]|uniref:glycosyltransferase family 4 protein n=1 Tax=Clostridium felsineum TaxID=36839 RepID=UPI00098BE378|nr:glycosyltransferase family 4 protein [Clostridium felsineum]URZ03541.1 Glycogen synthase [Clostridium felsineum]
MKILIIHNTYKNYGGEDKAVDDLIKLLKDKNIEVYVYKKNNIDIDQYDKLNKIKLIKNSFCSNETIKELKLIIQTFKPDIAHIHNIYPLISPSVYKVLHDNKIKIVQTVHNYRFLCPNGLFYRSGEICTKCLEKNNFMSCIRYKCYRNSFLQSLWYSLILKNGYKKGYFNKIDKFIVFNSISKKNMIRKGFEENDIEIIPNYTYGQSKDNLRDTKKNYIIFVGRLSQEKGIETLLEAMKNLKNVELKILGDGILKEEIKNRIRKFKMNNVKLLGFKQGEEKIELIKEAKALIFTSEWYETFGLTIIEAFANRTTVIASNIGGISDIVEDGKNGLLFKIKDSKDLELKIKYVLDNKEKLELFSNNAYNTFKSKYSENVFYENIISLYRSLINYI